MTGWLPPLRLAGIEVRVHVLLLVVPLLLAATAPAGEGEVAWRLAVFGALLASVLVHEFGHALVARAGGLPADVRVHGFGAWARIGARDGAPARGVDEWVVALAGPVASLLFAGALLAGLLLAGRSTPTVDLARG